MDFENDRLYFGEDLPECEYCGCQLTEEEFEDNGTVCDRCVDTDSLVRKADVEL